MGLSCSCPLAIYFDFENSFESVVSKSANQGNDDQKMPTHSISLENERSEPKILRSSSSKKLTNESSIRFRTRKTQHIEGLNDDKYVHRDILSPLSRQGSSIGKSPRSQLLDPNSPKHEAAIKLQKVYKSFRTRRKLADCAVLVEQSWWKLLDFAELKHSSISFFDIEKHETAISRWSRARTRAAKVGKGLSQNEKAQKLALQHWLEAIDPRHRYGHNLHFYYKTWLTSQSKQPFFYWLDIGEGKEINLVEKCPRSTLQTQCIKYLGPMERMAYEVAVVDGKLLYKESGKLLNTIDEPKGCKWIFILSTSRTLYVGKKTKGLFQHSSFLAGGATLAAGRIVAERGVLKAVWPHSGHYRPTPENFQDFKSFLIENSVDLTSVKLAPIDDEEECISKRGSAHFRCNSSEEDLVEKAIEAKEEPKPHKHENDSIQEKSHGFLRELTALKIPSNDDFLEMLKNEHETTESIATDENCMSEEATEEIITEESVFRRINSHKDLNSYQLGKQLSCKWSTGAGPRISCLRDYPSGLQNHALEQVSLSPRSNRRLRFELHSQSSTPTSIDSNLSHHNSRNSRSVYSADNAVMHSSV